jgi:segregation and condensation protein A
LIPPAGSGTLHTAMDYRVDLPAFHGPLDLLLYLVKKNEVDVLDIPIAKVAEQFQAYLAVLHAADVELAGDFLVMAATLMEIKSKLLLPQAPAAGEAEEADPRRELVKQLVEYKKYKEAAARLEQRAASHQRRLPRSPVAAPAAPGGPPPVQPVELWDLVSAFGRIMSETQALAPKQVVVDDTPQRVYQEAVRRQVLAAGRVRFRDLFTPPYHRSRLVGLFLAVLELIKRRAVELEQPEVFGEIWLCPGPAADSEGEGGAAEHQPADDGAGG